MRMYIANEEIMRDLGNRLAQHSQHALIFLEGDLGAGKTTFVQGFLKGCGYQGLVKSPTYTLVESYSTPRGLVHHFDLYRIKQPEELELMGIRDYLSEGATCLIEWPQNALSLLPIPTLCCTITQPIAGPGREVILTANTDQGILLLNQFQRDAGNVQKSPTT